MLLQLDENYRVVCDSMNFILEKYEDVKIKGTEEYKKEWKTSDSLEVTLEVY